MSLMLNDYGVASDHFPTDLTGSSSKETDTLTWETISNIADELSKRKREIYGGFSSEKYLKCPTLDNTATELSIINNRSVGTPNYIFESYWGGFDLIRKEKKVKHKKVIFNNPATIVIWEDGTRTVVKTCEGDTFDKTTGYLQAYFQKVSGMSKTQSGKFLRELVEELEE